MYNTNGIAERSKSSLLRFVGPVAIIVSFLAGFFCVALVGIGFGSTIPGDLGDNRFNNYVLEHVYQWLCDAHGLWDAPFFYPYPDTLAFSGNHLGSAIFYAVFRLLGADTLTAFQWWYLASFVLNYSAAAYALWRLKLGLVAAAFGAFIFAFSMVILYQQGHAQLMYRFAVPLACLALWQLSRECRLGYLLLLILWFVWQFAIEIYTGVFLLFLLTAMIVLIPMLHGGGNLRSTLLYWPHVLGEAWLRSTPATRIIFILLSAPIIVFWVWLLAPYVEVTSIYHFKRDWNEVSHMLPRPESYILNSHSLIYRFPSQWFANLPMPWEHQLFLGLGVISALILSVIKRTEDAVLRMQFKLNLLAILLLVLVTFNFGDYSPYRLIQAVPGISAIRGVSRIILVILWPVAVVGAIGVNSLLCSKTRPFTWRLVATAVMVATFLDAFCMRQPGFSKAEAADRITRGNSLVPLHPPSNPILFLAASPDQTPEYFGEIDAMLLAQHLGWPTLNGYSGNAPPTALGSPYSCLSYPRRIASALLFLGRFTEPEYLRIVKRVVAIGFDDCTPELAQKLPFQSLSKGRLPEDLLKKLRVRVLSLKTYKQQLRVDLEIENASLLNLPALAVDDFPFQIAVRLVDTQTNLSSGFDYRAQLDFDLLPGKASIQSLWIPMPQQSGIYRVDASGVQEYVVWLHDLGMPIARSAQLLKLANGEASILPGN